MSRRFGNTLVNQTNQVNNIVAPTGKRAIESNSPDAGLKKIKPLDVKSKNAFLPSSVVDRENTAPPSLAGKVLLKHAKVPHVDLDTIKAEASARCVIPTDNAIAPRRTRASKGNDEVVVLEKQPREDSFLKGINFGEPATYYLGPKEIPQDIEDFDKTQITDLTSEPHYAQDIFNYYKAKEVELKVVKYMSNQADISKAMRAVLVDWMVEVQESFELNHETLYLAVKLVDHYLMTKSVSKARFQLLGATCIFIASKFDERVPPAIEDFLYICDDAYQRRDVILMEIEVLKKLKFFIGFPISYRFLRRFARVCLV